MIQVKETTGSAIPEKLVFACRAGIRDKLSGTGTAPLRLYGEVPSSITRRARPQLQGPDDVRHATLVAKTSR